MCDCIDKMDKALNPHGVHVPVTYNCTSGGKFVSIVTIKNTDNKKRGFQAPFLNPVFCPFCGEKYPETLK